MPGLQYKAPRVRRWPPLSPNANSFFQRGYTIASDLILQALPGLANTAGSGRDNTGIGHQKYASYSETSVEKQSMERPPLVCQIAGPSTCQSFIASNHSVILAPLATAGTLSSAHATSQLPFVVALDR
ncbi:uncharacterized protein N7506_007862 [Penicillium brevicompactum]|uniref:uncharacterized protein n=1 Tax=Penicillium brevicompactum TaxID=5074 RepID=UPI00254109D0|nr:uncharacterized protein N7506_007862 [Penicillium brevicompactum]KAJ5334079.1 hypothetical protein N7506_007862 [Penicillium brevicompactum]